MTQAFTLPVELIERDLEETFLASLGWAMQYEAQGRSDFPYSTYISEGIGLDPAHISDPQLRVVFNAMLAEYAESETFSWQLLRWRLWGQGMMTEGLHIRLADIIINRFTTTSAISTLVKTINESAIHRRQLVAAEQLLKGARGGFE